MTRSGSIRAASNFYLGEAYKLKGQGQKALSYYEAASKSSQWKRAAEYEIDIIKNPDKYAY